MSTKTREDLIRARLAQIAKLHGGRLTPEAVVEDAKSLKSPLHDHFEWDDSIAAQHWRTEQARQLIRSITVEITHEERTISTVRYVRDPAAGAAQGYVEVAKLKTNADLAREALRSEVVQIEARLDRAQGLAIALGLNAELGEAQERLANVRALLDKAA